MSVDKIKKDLYLLLKKYSINIDELDCILNDIFYEKYNRFYKSYSFSNGTYSSSPNTSSSNSSLCDRQCTCNTYIEEDTDIKNNNPNCDF
jgi:hypothetical protein